jgi:hypothetical protein
MIMVNLTTAARYTSTSSGGTFTLSTVFHISDVLSASTWASYAALYQEFRIVGMKLLFIPKFQNATSLPASGTQAVTSSPIYLAGYHGNGTALGTEDAAANHSPVKMVSVNQPVSAEVRMMETDEAVWLGTSVSSGLPMFGVKTFLTGNTGTSDAFDWGTTIQVFAVQFRGRLSVANEVRVQIAPQPVVVRNGVMKVDEKDTDEYEIVRRPLAAARFAAAAAVPAASPSKRN